MPRGDQVARFYTLLFDLMPLKRGLPVESLARKHDWNVRTVYRDLKALEQAGVPLLNEGARWRLVEGWQRALPFPLSAGERAALHVARALFQPLRGTPFARAYERIHERLAGAHSPRQGELFARLSSLVSTPSLLAIDYREHSAILDTLARACEERRTVRAVYFTASRGELTTRELDPLHLHFDPRLEALYLFGWCHLRAAIRTFAVHRFKQARITDRPFPPRPDFTPESHLRNAFRLWRTDNVAEVRLAIDPPDSTWVGERKWHASQKLKKRAGGGCMLELTVDPGVELERFVLQLGAAVDVLEPAALRARLAREHEAAAKRMMGAAQESLTLDDMGMPEAGQRG